MDVPSQLQSMKGVLAVRWALSQAAQAVTRMREDVEHLLSSLAPPRISRLKAGVFDRLATNLGALGFLIDMMGVQPTLPSPCLSSMLKQVCWRRSWAAKLPPAELDDPIEAAAQHVQQVQLEEAQSVAENVSRVLQRDDVCLTEVTSLQKLADNHDAVQEQSELADLLAAAQTALKLPRHRLTKSPPPPPANKSPGVG